MGSENLPRVAIVGAGLMGRWHAYYAQQLGIHLVAMVDSDATARHKILPKAKNIIRTDSLSAILEGESVDVVHICTPLASHFALAEEAMRAGCHVLAEKPLTMTLAETLALLEIAQQHNRLLCPVYQMPFQHRFQSIRQQIALEKVVGIHFLMRSAGGEGFDDQAKDQLLTEILPHPLSIVHALGYGSLSELSWQTVHAQAGEVLMIAAIEGVSISIEISLQGRPTTNMMTIVSQDKTWVYDFFHGYGIQEAGHVSQWRKIAHPFDTASRHLMVAGVNLVQRRLQNEPAYPGLRNLFQAFYQAIDTSPNSPIARATIEDIERVRHQLALNLSISTSASPKGI